MSLTQLLSQFDEQGFKNEAKIIGMKRVETKYFIRDAYLQGVEEGKKQGYKKGVRDAVARNFTPGGDDFK